MRTEEEETSQERRETEQGPHMSQSAIRRSNPGANTRRWKIDIHPRRGRAHCARCRESFDIGDLRVGPAARGGAGKFHIGCLDAQLPRAQQFEGYGELDGTTRLAFTQQLEEATKKRTTGSRRRTSNGGEGQKRRHGGKCTAGERRGNPERRCWQPCIQMAGSGLGGNPRKTWAWTKWKKIRRRSTASGTWNGGTVWSGTPSSATRE